MSDNFFDAPPQDIDTNVKELLSTCVTVLNGLNHTFNQTYESIDFEMMLRDTAHFIDGYFGGYAPIFFLEKLLAYYKQRKQQIITNDLPSLMHELGTSKITLESGETVELRTDVSVSCPKEQKHQLYDWLSKEGHQDEIKTKVEFNKGDFTEDVERRLDESGMPFTVTQDVHAQTLKRIFRERMEEGKPVPDASIAKVTTFEYAKVK